LEGTQLLSFFRYNWQIRDEYFLLCRKLPEEEVIRPRVGGVGSILRTLFHIVDVEYSWILLLQGKPDFQDPFEKFDSLEKVKKLSDQVRPEVERFLQTWTNEMEDKRLTLTGKDGRVRQFRYGEVIRHVIAHEIHHIGQLSVWVRELGYQPASANFIGRGLMD
jgi:uncharacterized damage-inducible protein DinB